MHAAVWRQAFVGSITDGIVDSWRQLHQRAPFFILTSEADCFFPLPCLERGRIMQNETSIIV
jgi:hypothetical protein